MKKDKKILFIVAAIILGLVTNMSICAESENSFEKVNVKYKILKERKLTISENAKKTSG